MKDWPAANHGVLRQSAWRTDYAVNIKQVF